VNARTYIARSICALLAGFAGLGVSSPALAQRANGPYSGALGGGQDDAARTQGLDLHAQMFGGLDQNLFPDSEAASALDPRLKESSSSAGVAAGLLYGRRSDNAQFILNGSANASEYSSSPVLASAYQGNTSLSTKLTRSLTFEANGSASYSPFYEFAPFSSGSMTNAGLFGGGNPEALAGGFDYAAVAERVVRLDGAIGLTENFTKRTSLSVGASGRDWRMPDSSQNDMRSWGGHASLRHSLTRALGVHLGYGREQTEYALADLAPYVNETIDAGVDYGNTLSFARRTALSFTTSTSMMRYLGDTHYRLNGSAQLTRGFRRSWSASVGYNRDTDFRIGFREPLLIDSVNAGVGGQLALRARWSAGGGYTRGTVGFGSDTFAGYTGSSRLNFALTRSLAAFAQYAYYHYDMPAGASQLDLVSSFSRQTGTVGLTLSLRLINDVRAPKPTQQP
jgi:hypothetical protein